MILWDSNKKALLGQHKNNKFGMEAKAASDSSKKRKASSAVSTADDNDDTEPAEVEEPNKRKAYRMSEVPARGGSSSSRAEVPQLGTFPERTEICREM